MTPDEKEVCSDYLQDSLRLVKSGNMKTLLIITNQEDAVPDSMILGDLNYEDCLMMLGALETLKRTVLNCIDDIEKQSVN